MARKNFETSDETVKIADFLHLAPFGTTISFQTISDSVGFPVTSQLPAYQSAKRILMRDHGEVIESVRGVGCSKLQSGEILRRTPAHFRAIKTRAKRGETEIEIAISGNLNRVEMLQAGENYARLRIIADNANPAKSTYKPIPEPEKAEEKPPTEIAKNILPLPKKP